MPCGPKARAPADFNSGVPFLSESRTLSAARELPASSRATANADKARRFILNMVALLVGRDGVVMRFGTRVLSCRAGRQLQEGETNSHHLLMGGRLFLAPKGHNNLAQANGLGGPWAELLGPFGAKGQRQIATLMGRWSAASYVGPTNTESSSSRTA